MHNRAGCGKNPHSFSALLRAGKCHNAHLSISVFCLYRYLAVTFVSFAEGEFHSYSCNVRILHPTMSRSLRFIILVCESLAFAALLAPPLSVELS